MAVKLDLISTLFSSLFPPPHHSLFPVWEYHGQCWPEDRLVISACCCYSGWIISLLSGMPSFYKQRPADSKFPGPWVAPISVDYTPASLSRPRPRGNQQVYTLSNWSLIISFISENVNKCTVHHWAGNYFLLTSHSWGYWILRRVGPTCHLLVMYTAYYPLS